MFGEAEAEEKGKGRGGVVGAGREELQRPKFVGLETMTTVMREGLLTPELRPPDDGDEPGSGIWRPLGEME